MSIEFEAITSEELKLRTQPLGGYAREVIAEDGQAKTQAPQAAFATILSRLGGQAERSIEDRQIKARQAAEEFVAIALVQPILAHLREYPLVADEERGPLARGTGEKMMQPLWDAQAALDIVRASNWPMVDRLAQQLLRQSDAFAVQAGKEIDRHA